MLFFDIAIDEEGGREPFALGPTKVWIKKVWEMYFPLFSLIGEQNEHFLSSNNLVNSAPYYYTSSRQRGRHRLSEEAPFPPTDRLVAKIRYVHTTCAYLAN